VFVPDEEEFFIVKMGNPVVANKQISPYIFRVMRYIATRAIIWSLVFGVGLHAGHAQKREDCRLNTEELQPVIQRFNPFFAHHRWDAERHTEIARLSNEKVLVISQHGCKRHHTVFTLFIQPSAVTPTLDFWLSEVKSLMYKVYYGQEELYAGYKGPFEEMFEEKLERFGLDNSFNFPVGTRNFVCNVYNHPNKGAQIRIEMVAYIFAEKVVKMRPKGIPPEQDDGWKGGRHR